MCDFFKNSRGVVTVFVSLLLIPAILVSGTAVDLARLHTARSIVQDANQLAGNAVLTQYESMLQDSYGLYAVMESDPVLGGMLNDYIEVSIFGEGWQDKELGTFQLFYGTGSPTNNINPVANQNLRNPDVLRRQIEEYAKFRAPVIIIDEIFERINNFKKVKEDAEAIKKKMDIDDKIDEIDKIYEEIYNLINTINKYPDYEKSAFDSVNTYLGDIKKQFEELRDTRQAWTDAFDSGDEDLAGDYEKKYKGIKQNIDSLVNSGNVVSNWIPGDYNDDGEWVDGKWGSSYRSNGLNKAIGDRKKDLTDCIDLMEELVKKCKKADDKKAELAQLVTDLDNKLKSGKCSDELVSGMNTPDESGKSTIEQYRDLLKHSLKPMADAMKNKNETYINGVIAILNDVEYGSVSNNVLGDPRISRANLRTLSNNIKFDINNIVAKRTVPSTDVSTLNQLAAVSYRYTQPNNFKKFNDPEFNSTKNAEFYRILEDRYGAGADNAKKAKKEAEDKVNKGTKEAQEKFKKIADIATLTPSGAKYYKSGNDNANSGFGNEGDWGKKKEASNKTKNALNSSIITQIGDFLNDAGNKILLLTYDSEMFSNYTTEEGTKSMAGVPMGKDVNYFFQSEVEYLYNGNKASARSNIAAVSGMILLVRFVFNYIATFSLDNVKYELKLISMAAGPYAIIVRELARLGYALGESAIDVANLMAGKSVPLLKNEQTDWTFSLQSAAIQVIGSVVESVTGDDSGKKTGMYYIDYLRIFLLFVDGDTLASRTADLITWNVTNKKRGLNASESAMGSATLIDLSKAHTGFSISTTVDLRMIFLSMGFAQKGINGVIPPKTMPVTVTDYRGY